MSRGQRNYLLVVAAGGYASRALTLTGFGAKPKCLINAGAGGATVLEEILREAEQSGLHDVLIVLTADRDPKVFDRLIHPLREDPTLGVYLEERGKLAELELIRSRPRFRVRYARQPVPRGFGEAVGMAYGQLVAAERKRRPYLGVAVALGDDLVHAPVPCLAQLLSAHQQTEALTLAVQAVSRNEATQYGVVQVEPEPLALDATFIGKQAYRVVAVDEKPENPKPNLLNGKDVYLAIVGRYVLNVADVEFLSVREGSLSRELDFTDLLRHNIEFGRLIAVEIRGTWHSVGTPLQAQRAFTHFALVPTTGEPTPDQRELARYVRALLTEIDEAESRRNQTIHQ
jgi:UTP--glucose-1-phosphate uridylyltransferase